MSASKSFRSVGAWARSKPVNTWTVEDVRKLRELAEQGLEVHVIAAQLRRTVSAIRNKASMHGISLHGGRTTRARNGNSRNEAA
jgi:hypothetical protein